MNFGADGLSLIIGIVIVVGIFIYIWCEERRMK